MKKIIAATIIFSILLLSCRRDHVVPHISLDPEFKAWCAFKPGAWWTFKEIASNRMDSLYVTGYSETQYYTHERPNRSYDDFDMQINSSADTFGIHYFAARPPLISNGMSVFTETYTIPRVNEFRFCYRNDSANSLLTSDSIFHLDSLRLTSTGIIYYDVVKFSKTIQEYGLPVKSEYYVRNIGVIRKEMFNGEIWEVQNFNIVQ